MKPLNNSELNSLVGGTIGFASIRPDPTALSEMYAEVAKSLPTALVS